MINKDFTFSSILILIAVLTDRLDGFTARKFNITSELGKNLDSLSDLISFGVAPALLVYYSILYKFNTIGLVFTFIYIMCGAFRLARYNVVEFTGFYVGMPITIAGAILTVLFSFRNILPPSLYIIFILILSYLMVSRIAIKKR